MVRPLLFAALLAGASPVFAQAGAPLPDPNDQSDTFTIAAGGALIPDYEGSDDSEFMPFAAIRGRVSGFEFYMRETHLYVDLLRQPSSGMDFDFGPIVGVRLNRTGSVEDDFVDALPERDMAFEVGAFAGISFHGLTNPYDELSLRLDFKHDIGGAHGSSIISPNIDFGTPLSRRTYLGLSAGLDFVGDGWADYYYSVSPADSIASLLPVYEAEGGMKNWRLGALINQSITGDLTGGFSIFAGANYSHLSGDIADSPIVDLRGQRSQWQLAAGLAYTW
ncbi:MipA/OmpV family protein [Sphingomonas sp. HDW15A]|uniref:MipA/OmpV family protein n=1 Tax=Sphingomonas sp. HDW15A TaxID=2714942 RepID=UPI00140C9C70|nr:MipA/OmpV family protein [Sphingomonas sp. HDW15A]QIK96907.1 MipA/OmpV family protein [Sphingomonas sp. HDW15A]